MTSTQDKHWGRHAPEVVGSHKSRYVMNQVSHTSPNGCRSYHADVNGWNYAGVLSLECLARIVIDGSHVDKKKRGIVDIRDTAVPLLRLLVLDGLRNAYQGIGHDSSRVKILVF